MFRQAQRSCHSCVPTVAFLWEKCRRHFRHGSSPQILTQLLEITPMDRYLYLLGRNSCASLPLPGAAQCCRVANQKPEDVSASQILCNINVVTRLQSKGATLSLHSVLSEHMPSCSFSPSSPPTEPRWCLACSIKRLSSSVSFSCPSSFKRWRVKSWGLTDRVLDLKSRC